MKTFKNFAEDAGVNTSHTGTDLDSHTTGQSLANSSLLRKLNVYVGAVAKVSVKLPEETIAEIRQKLARLGITFDQAPVVEGASGSFSLPIKRYGGVFGKSNTTAFDEFDNEDGTGVEGGLSLKITYEETEANCYKMTASIE